MYIKSQRGFSLVEMMVVVAIVAIIAAVALPSYTQYLLKSRRSDAKAGLVALTNLQETFYASNGTYAANLTGNDSLSCNTKGICSATGGSANEAISADGHYTFTITASNARSYTITAVPVSGGAQEDDTECAQFSITERLVKTATNDSCW